MLTTPYFINKLKKKLYLYLHYKFHRQKQTRQAWHLSELSDLITDWREKGSKLCYFVKSFRTTITCSVQFTVVWLNTSWIFRTYLHLSNTLHCINMPCVMEPVTMHCIKAVSSLWMGFQRMKITRDPLMQYTTTHGICLVELCFAINCTVLWGAIHNECHHT